jgi:hypothetical protein
MNRAHYTTLAWVSGAIALSLFGAWIYLLSAGFSLRDRIDTAGQAAAVVAAKESYLITLKKAVLDSRADVERLDQRLLTEDGVPAFIDLLEGKMAATGADADLGSIALDDVAAGAPVRLLHMHIAATGSWKDLMALVSMIEGMPYVLDIRDLALSKAGTGWSFNADVTGLVTNAQ